MFNQYQHKQSLQSPVRRIFFLLTALLLSAALFCPAAVLAQDDYWISQYDLEQEIAQIKSWYYSPTAAVSQYSKYTGDDGWNYERRYYYHNGSLFFAYIFSKTEEHRLYFKDDHMIRYIDENYQTYDFGNLSAFRWWENKALQEAYGYDTGQAENNPGENPGNSGYAGGVSTQISPAQCAGKYVSSSDDYFLVTANPHSDCIFVNMMSSGGTLLEEFRNGWRKDGQSFCFTRDSGLYTQRYVRLMFEPAAARLTLYDDQLASPVVFYRTDEYQNADLITLARQYYAWGHGGYCPAYVEIDWEDYGSVRMHLYDIIDNPGRDSFTATMEWYHIDRSDASGTNYIDEPINLTIFPE